MHVTRYDQNMGIIPLLTAAASTFAASQAKPGGGAPAPGAAPGGSTSTVSPVIQTKISPQISPVFQPIIGSAGATAYGSAQQIASGSQTASTRGGDLPGFSAPSSPYSAPLLPSSFDPFGSQQTSQFDITRYQPSSPFAETIRAQLGINWNIMLMGSGIIVAGLIAFSIYRQPRRAKRGATRR